MYSEGKTPSGNNHARISFIKISAWVEGLRKHLSSIAKISYLFGGSKSVKLQKQTAEHGGEKKQINKT